MWGSEGQAHPRAGRMGHARSKGQWLLRAVLPPFCAALPQQYARIAGTWPLTVRSLDTVRRLGYSHAHPFRVLNFVSFAPASHIKGFITCMSAMRPCRLCNGQLGQPVSPLAAATLLVLCVDPAVLSPPVILPHVCAGARSSYPGYDPASYYASDPYAATAPSSKTAADTDHLPPPPPLGSTAAEAASVKPAVANGSASKQAETLSSPPPPPAAAATVYESREPDVAEQAADFQKQ